MYKKITLSAAAEVVAKFTNEKIAAFFEKNESIYPELAAEHIPVLAYRFYKDGKNMRHCYCPVCRNEWEEEDTPSYAWSRNREPHCKVCDNYALRNVVEKFTITAGKQLSVILEVNKTNGYIVFAYFTPSYTFDLNNKDITECLLAGNYDFLKGNFKKNIESFNATYAIFMLDKGIRIRQYSSDLYSPVSNDSYTKTRNLLESKLLNYNIEEAIELFKENGVEVAGKSVFGIIEDVCDEISNKKAKVAAKKERKPNEELVLYSSYEAKPIDEALMIKHGSSALNLLKTEIGSMRTFIRYCTECGEISEGPIENSAFTCPHCHTTNTLNRYYGSSRGQTASNSKEIELFEVMEETNDLIIRLVNVTQTLAINGDLSFKVQEIMRYYFTPKKILIFNCNGKTLTKGTVYDLDRNQWGSGATIIQSDEENKELIMASNLKYSGLAEAWGLTGLPPINGVGKHSRTSYLYLWYKRPCMEQLLKTGLSAAVKDVLNMSADNLYRYVDVNATSVYSILRITKPVFKIAREMNLDAHNILSLKRLWEFDNTLTAETFKKIKDLGAIDAICDIASRYNIPFVKIIDYIDSCYNNQCIQKSEAIRLWADYLRMAKDMTYRLDNKNTKFPQSLKKEHDRATFAYRVVQNEMNQKRFKEQAEENIKYEYSFDKLFVKVPRTPEEIIEEGTNQKHCVASYVNRVREGDTVVAFIRYKELPNDSYFTIEIKDDVVVQVKGYTNSAPTDKKLLEFLDKFAKAKNLKLRYH